MSFQRAALLQVLLEGVPLPAEKHALLDYARRQEGGGDLADDLERLPDRKFRSLDEVGELIVSVQPDFAQPGPLPRPESAEPPGGEAYTEGLRLAGLDQNRLAPATRRATRSRCGTTV
jgi:hypothetical protein